MALWTLAALIALAVIVLLAVFVGPIWAGIAALILAIMGVAFWMYLVGRAAAS